MVDTFLDNSPFPLLGAVIHVVLKRYPNEKDIDKLVAKVRQSGASVRVLIATNSSGGLYPETMYNLATKTNGLGYFSTEEVLVYAESHLSVFNNYPDIIYAVNVNVSGSGSMILPDLILPPGFYPTADYWFGITLQDSGVISSFQNMTMTLSSSTDSFSEKPFSWQQFELTNFVDGMAHLPGFNYKVTFDYEYSDTRTQTLQIRWFGLSNTMDYWIPYAD